MSHIYEVSDLCHTFRVPPAPVFHLFYSAASSVATFKTVGLLLPNASTTVLPGGCDAALARLCHCDCRRSPFLAVPVRCNILAVKFLSSLRGCDPQQRLSSGCEQVLENMFSIICAALICWLYKHRVRKEKEMSADIGQEPHLVVDIWNPGRIQE